MEPLWIRNDLVVPIAHLAVSYTRALTRVEDGEVVVLDSVQAAKQNPSAVELRLDVRACDVFDEAQKAKIIAWRPLGADRRGVVRVTFGEAETRPKNLAGARERLADAILEALAAPEPGADATPAKAKRGRGGLFKAR